MTKQGHVFVVAEAGSNWRVGSAADDRNMGRELIRAARDSGADAVKFQTFRAKTTYAPNAGQVGYLSGVGVTGSINELFRDLEMSYELVAELSEFAGSVGIEFMSSPFSVEDLAAVDPYVVRHKLASYEISHVRLLEAMSQTGKPLLISTGAATYDDIEFALTTARANGADDITLLQCTAKYPAPLERINLNVIPTLRARFATNVGLSDHSRDPFIAPLGAVALGATAIEKHFTMDRSLPGPDHQFAIEVGEMKAMVAAIRSLEQALGVPEKAVSDVEEELASFAVRALQAVTDISAGEEFVEGLNFDVLRPGSRSRGLHPRHLSAVAGRRSVRAIPAGEGITAADVDPPLVHPDAIAGHPTSI